MTRTQVVLFLCGGRRVALLRHFKALLAPSGGRVLTTDTDPTSATALEADRTFAVAPCAAAERFADDVVRICRDEGVTAVVPLTCGAVARMPDLAGRVKAALLGGDAEAVAIATDKLLTARHFALLGLPTPEVFDRPRPDDLPVFSRPRRGEGSKGARAIRDAEDLARQAEDDDRVFTRFVEGPEYSVDCCKSLDGRLFAVVPRRRLKVRAGEVEKAVTVHDEVLMELARRALEPLRFTGPATLQAIRGGGRFFLTEINLRFGGGVTLSIAAGMDTPARLLAELAGLPPADPPSVRWGLGMSRFDQDIYFDAGEVPS